MHEGTILLSELSRAVSVMYTREIGERLNMRTFTWVSRDLVHKKYCADARPDNHDRAKIIEVSIRGRNRAAKGSKMYRRLLTIGFPLVVVSALFWTTVVVLRDLWRLAGEMG